MAHSPTSDNAGKQILLCDCGKTMNLDGAALAEALGSPAPFPVASHLCTSQQDQLRSRIEASNGEVVIACTQFKQLFTNLAEEIGVPAPHTVNIREQAGWSDEGEAAGAKMAALLSQAAGPSQQQSHRLPAQLLSMTSHGRCLIYGGGETALELASELAATLGVTVMLHPQEAEITPGTFGFNITTGVLTHVQGSFTAFDLEIDGFAELLPHSRGQALYGPSANGVKSGCDILIDLTGDLPLVSGWDRRDGYFRADPSDLVKIRWIRAQASEMIGAFEKPLYVRFDASLCAHSRNGLTGCQNCLEVCPAGAILSVGDSVQIDPGICGGCGMCGAVCPSGAAQTAVPAIDDALGQITQLAHVYTAAGGQMPWLLLHDATYGSEVIATLARFGSGLPARLIPYGLHSVGRVGYDLLIGAVASGFARILVLIHPKQREEFAGFSQQIALASALLDGAGISAQGRFEVIDEADPEQIAVQIWAEAELPSYTPVQVTPLGAPRAVTRLVMKGLAQGNLPSDSASGEEAIIPLPKAAPFGRVDVNSTACTLCLSCVGACPSGALQDNPDTPQLLFKEDACLQCGICVATCPESAITLVPQYNLSDSAMATELVVEDKPFHCTACGKAFGTTRSIEAVIERLTTHSMFTDDARLAMLKMCEDCRVDAIFSHQDKMLDVPDRKPTRTTDDYLT